MPRESRATGTAALWMPNFRQRLLQTRSCRMVQSLNHSRWIRILCLLVMLMLRDTGWSEATAAERLLRSRSAAMGRHGMAATSQPLATLAALDVLRAGGNAADAAIAANAVLGVVEPMMCGIGGDLFVLYWDAKTQRLYGLNASGRSPYGMTRTWVAEQGLAEIPWDGPLSWSVPGCGSGLAAAR
jgi:gamma-glutamyltranspeptidase/glutathione hydrolase